MAAAIYKKQIINFNDFDLSTFIIKREYLQDWDKPLTELESSIHPGCIGVPPLG